MRRLVALFVLTVAIAGCGSTAAERSATGDPSAAAPPSSGSDTGGDPEGDTASVTPDDAPSDTAGPAGDAPLATVDAVGGGQIDGTELAGRDLALWFWAPW